MEEVFEDEGKKSTTSGTDPIPLIFQVKVVWVLLQAWKLYLLHLLLLFQPVKPMNRPNLKCLMEGPRENEVSRKKLVRGRGTVNGGPVTKSPWYTTRRWRTTKSKQNRMVCGNSNLMNWATLFKSWKCGTRVCGRDWDVHLKVTSMECLKKNWLTVSNGSSTISISQGAHYGCPQTSCGHWNFFFLQIVCINGNILVNIT